MLDSIFSEEENATAFVFAPIILKIWSFCLNEMTISRWMEGGIFCDIRKSLTHARIRRSEIHHKNMSPHKQETKDLSSKLSTRDSPWMKARSQKASAELSTSAKNNFFTLPKKFSHLFFCHSTECHAVLFTCWRSKISLIEMGWRY